MKKGVQEGWNQWRKSSGVIKKKKKVSARVKEKVYKMVLHGMNMTVALMPGQGREQSVASPVKTLPNRAVQPRNKSASPL